MKYKLLAVALVLYALGTAYLWYGRPTMLPVIGAAVILPSTDQPAPAEELRSVSPQAPLILIVEPNDGLGTLLSTIAAATKNVDLVIYELDDTQVEQALCNEESKGVAVRVLIQNVNHYGKHPNQAAYDALQGCGVAVKWAPNYFALTHQKTFIVDNTTAIVMTFNLVSKYYATGRDFGLVDADSKDVAAIVAAFAADWNGQRTNAGEGSDLVWSPGSASTLLALIASASSTLDIYNEEMADQRVTDALMAAAQRGVKVRVDMTYQSGWKGAFKDLEAAGAEVRTYSSSAKLYIHAKVIVADNKEAFVGSENFSQPSLDANRELGLLITRPDVLSQLQQVFNQDWAGSRSYSPKS
ncbi:MAG TPA: phospholipase D-like domain-containing protein [Candidatus Paceibacterota bacterium]